MERAKVWRGGIAGLTVGLLLLGLAVFFLVVGPERPPEVFGIFVPVATALVGLALGVAALVPLRHGDGSTRTLRIIGIWFVAVVLVGVLLTVAGVLRGEWPWTLGGALPTLVAALILWDGIAILRRAAR